jgi:hypothetical protein
MTATRTAATAAGLPTSWDAIAQLGNQQIELGTQAALAMMDAMETGTRCWQDVGAALVHWQSEWLRMAGLADVESVIGSAGLLE